MKSQGPLPIRILTHNVRYATEAPFKGEELWSIRKSRIASQLRFNTIYNEESFICLQEVLYEQLEDILASLNRAGDRWKHIGVGRDDGKRAGEYSPIFYRPTVWRLLEHRTIWLSETPDIPSRGWDAASIRILTVGRFLHNVTKKELVAMNTHLDDQGSTSRLEAAKMIAKEVESFSSLDEGPNPPVFLCGDFNSKPDMEAYCYLTQHSSLVDTQQLVSKENHYGHFYTFTGFDREKKDFTRIDFLFIKQRDRNYPRDTNCDWEAQSYAVLDNCFDDGVYSSDHRAVVADLLLR